MNFGKNVKVFAFNCRVIMRGTFLQRHTIAFPYQKNLRKRLYFEISCPCLYVGVLRKEYKILSKTMYWHPKSVLYIVMGLLCDVIALPTLSAEIIDLPVEKCLVPWLLSERGIHRQEIYCCTPNFSNLVSLDIWTGFYEDENLMKLLFRPCTFQISCPWISEGNY